MRYIIIYIILGILKLESVITYISRLLLYVYILAVGDLTC